MALILDSGPLYASLDVADANHHACRRLIEAIPEPVVIPSPILPEVDYFVRERMHGGVMIGLLEDVSAGAYLIEDLMPPDYRRIRELLHRYADLDIGFVDAAVFVVAERLGEDKLATLDHRHFSVLRPRHVDALRLLPE